MDRYNSGLEHTFLWVVETKNSQAGSFWHRARRVAHWNDLIFLPLRTFKEGVVPDVRVLHGLEDWEPDIE